MIAPASGRLTRVSPRSWNLWLATIAVGLLLAHVLVLVIFRHSASVRVLSSSVILCSELFGAVVCFLTGGRASGGVHRFWQLVGACFALACISQFLQTYDSIHPGVPAILIVKHFLFFFAAAPMFVAILVSDEGSGETVNWEWMLDTIQILALVVVIYLFYVYVPSLLRGERMIGPRADRLLLWRDVLLTAGLFARGVFARSRTMRRLFLPVSAVMALFALLTWFGNRAANPPRPLASMWYDLAWTVPFCLFTLAAILWRESPEEEKSAPQSLSISRALFAYLPALILPVILLANYATVVREQIIIGLLGLMFSIALFNARLLLTLRRQRLTTETLHAAEHQYQSLFERNMAGVFRSTLDGRLLDCNPAFANMLGYTQDELRRLPTWNLYFGGAEEWNRELIEFQRAGPHVPRELCYRRKDGSALWVMQSANFEKRPDGSEHLEATVIDITQRRALEAQFRQVQKMEAIGRLAAGVAHDFNNMLTIISGYSSIQLERTRPDNPTHHEAEEIKATADRAAALTRQLLAFSRQQVLLPKRVNLNDIVRNVNSMLRRLVGEDIEVLTMLSPGLGTVKVDPGQMDQVLMNLVVNARDAMPEGGKLTIQTENVELDASYVRKHGYAAAGRYVLLSVSDSGSGMRPEVQSRLFEPFFTTKEPGKGTGLGLPMVYGIVKQSGGTIEVYSELGHGTSLKIYLPRVDAEAEEETVAIESRSRQRGSERVLLVEDDLDVRRLIAAILTSGGYVVQTLEKTEELDSVIERTAECALLLTDVVMPGLNGPELAKRVLQHWPNIRVLYMSGYTTNAIVHHGVLDKGFHFLQKPFTPAALVSKVREVLDAPAQRAANS